MIKLLLSVSHPLAVASLLYLGAGAGIFVLNILKSPWVPFRGFYFSRCSSSWLIGTIIAGGVIAPVIQFVSLSVIPAAIAALLLNFEIIATAGVAWGIFHERINRNLFFAIILVFAGSLVLSWETGSLWSFSLGAAGIICSCLFWGLDNNLMGHIPLDNPSAIVAIKGLAGGGILFLTIMIIHLPLPDPGIILVTLLTGFFTFGIGLVSLIESLQSLGAARTGAYFAIAPFIGAFSSLVLFRDAPDLKIPIAVPLLVAGLIILISGQKSGIGYQVQRTLDTIGNSRPISKIGMSLTEMSRTVSSKINNWYSYYILIMKVI